MMSDEKGLIAQEEGPLGRIVITEQQVALIKNTVAMGATDDELKLFFFECRRRGVHPMDRLIHFVKRGQGVDAKATFQAGIDFMRSQAEATGEYRGQDDIEYGPMFQVNETCSAPTWARATVKRRDPITGELIATSATAYWDEFYPGDKLGFMWRKMPRVMLGKTAESQALRKAFPRQLAGLYSFEEMEQADIVQTPDRPPIQKPQEKKVEGTAAESNTVVTGVDSVTVLHFTKKDKSQGTKYKINAGEAYETFSETVAAEAKRAKECGLMVLIAFKSDQYGRKIDRLPGEDG
jgi:phage recombination protein Bet